MNYQTVSPSNFEMRRLFLGTVDDNFNFEKDLVLGPWCFIGRDKVVPYWEKTSFLNFRDSLDEADLVALVAYRITLLSNTLNRRHGLEHSFAFWWTISCRWMSTLILNAWRRWLYMEQFIDVYKDQPINVQTSPHPDQFIWKFSNTSEFEHKGLNNEQFDSWFWSVIAMRLVPESWICTPSTSSRDKIDNWIPSHPTPTLYRKLARDVIKRLPFYRVPGTSFVEQVLFSLFLNILPRNRQAIFRGTPIYSPPKAFPSSFLLLIDSLVERTMPLSLGADFSELAERVKKMNFKRGRLFVSGISCLDDQENLINAYATEAGERVVRVQHGCDYGTEKKYVTTSIWEYMDYAFLTWGWTQQNGYLGQFVPLPAPMTSSVRNRHRKKVDSMVYVSTRMMLRPTKSRDFWGSAVLNYRREMRSFMMRLNDDTRNHLIYRPYPWPMRDLDELSFLREEVKGLNTFCGSQKQLLKLLLTCRLLVMDNPGTTQILAMAANVPGVYFWEESARPLASEAQPYFEALREARILFSDGKIAADHVNMIWDDIPKWWESDIVQEARRLWVAQFARTSPVWWWEWLKTLSVI